ncbi:MAG: 6,7-dimethyl-8-ribityllumazine synthase [Gemmatimonadota bacterium]
MEFVGNLDGKGRRFAIVASRFNSLITDSLVEGARDALTRHGTAADAIDLIRVPGAWELPGAVARVLERGGYAAVIALGCVIRGATPHFDYVAGEASRGLGTLARESAVPVLFGVLTTNTLEQALERAGSKAGNKGWDAALAALEMVGVYDALASDT